MTELRHIGSTVRYEFAPSESGTVDAEFEVDLPGATRPERFTYRVHGFAQVREDCVVDALQRSYALARLLAQTVAITHDGVALPHRPGWLKPDRRAVLVAVGWQPWLRNALVDWGNQSGAQREWPGGDPFEIMESSNTGLVLFQTAKNQVHGMITKAEWSKVKGLADLGVDAFLYIRPGQQVQDHWVAYCASDLKVLNGLFRSEHVFDRRADAPKGCVLPWHVERVISPDELCRRLEELDGRANPWVCSGAAV